MIKNILHLHFALGSHYLDLGLILPERPSCSASKKFVEDQIYRSISNKSLIKTITYKIQTGMAEKESQMRMEGLPIRLKDSFIFEHARNDGKRGRKGYEKTQ